MMRHRTLQLVAALAMAVVANALDLTTFRQSFSRASRAEWSLSAGLSARDQTGRGASQDADLSGTLDWKTAILSDNFDLDAAVSGGTYGSGSNGNVPDTLPADAWEWSAAVYLKPTTTCHAYLFGTDAFIRSGFDANASAHVDDERQGGEHERSVVLGAYLRDGELGVGYGRMRDAGPLHRAVRLIDILRQEGVLQRELSDDDLRDLGGLLSRGWKLFYAHDRGAKFYYDSLEQWLLHAEAISEPLPALALFRLDETPLIGSDTRRFGWRGFLAADLELRRYAEWREETDSSWTELDTSSSRQFRIGGEWNRPVGLSWTFGASAGYILPWPRLQQRVEHHLELAGSASYDVTDRLVASYGIDANPWFWVDPHPGWDGYLSLPSVHTLDFSYYVSDRFAIHLGGRYETEFNLRTGVNPIYTDFRHRWAAALTMTFGRIPYGWGRHYYL